MRTLSLKGEVCGDEPLKCCFLLCLVGEKRCGVLAAGVGGPGIKGREEMQKVLWFSYWG